MSNIQYRDITLPEDAGGCLLCSEPFCTKACPYGLEVDKILRSVRFDNIAGAVNRLPEELPCLSCEMKPCKVMCLKGEISRPVPIDEMMESLATFDKVPANDADLSISFCGIQCENPFFLSSSVVGSNYEMVAKAFEMGWAGVAFKTIGTFVPDEVSPRFDALRKESVPFVGFKNIEQISDHTLEENLAFLRQLKKDYPTKIIIASIMGRSSVEWTELAELMTKAGADIIECNFSCPHMAPTGSARMWGRIPNSLRNTQGRHGEAHSCRFSPK